MNLGCGALKIDGFINIDAIEKNNPDAVMILGKDSLLEKFGVACADEVVASNIVEHLFHWEAVKLLQELFEIMVKDAILILGLPDFDAILERKDLSSEQKIVRLFGGQDIFQGEVDPNIRKEHPEFFCHKFSYTKESITKDLNLVGFSVVSIESKGTNILVRAKK